jgi:hypothetical protein
VRRLRALCGALFLAGGCAQSPVSDAATPGALRVRVGRIDAAALETALHGAPPELAERTEHLAGLFLRAGCLPSELAQRYPTGSPDLACSLPGRIPERIVVVAQLDGEPGASGVPRQWRGSALLPFLYQALGAEPREHSFEFVALGKRPGERLRDYLALLAARREGVRALVELLEPDPAAVWFSSSGAGLARDLVAASLAVGIPLDSLQPVRHPGARARAGIPTIAISGPPEDARERLPAVAASPAAEPASHLPVARLLAVYLAYLDESLGLRADRSAPSPPAPSQIP